MSESLKKKFATSAALLIMDGRITIEDVSPVFRELTIEILAEKPAE